MRAADSRNRSCEYVPVVRVVAWISLVFAHYFALSEINRCIGEGRLETLLESPKTGEAPVENRTCGRRRRIETAPL